MLAARDQENLAFSRQNGAALKQQQRTPGARFTNTPIKVPLNDENGAGGAKSVLGRRTKGNENTIASKGGKSISKVNLTTPSENRSRAVLGNKTTNAKARGGQTLNVKSTVRELEKSQVKAPTTIRQKQKHPQTEQQKLEVHAEKTDRLSEDEIEYCPPRVKDTPYESDVFPDGALNLDMIKTPKNFLIGFHEYYGNPVDSNGISLGDRELEARNRKAMKQNDKLIKDDIGTFEWAIQDEIDAVKKSSASSKPKSNADIGVKKSATTRPLSSLRAKSAADALSMDDTTKSLQRKAAKSTEVSRIPTKKTTSIPMPSFRRPASVQSQPLSKKSSLEIETNSRTTIGYTKGRSTASILAQGTAKPKRPASKTEFTRSDTTLSNESDMTITPARFAHNQASTAAEDLAWKERVPFLSIFNIEDDDDEDDDFDLAGGMHNPIDENDSFEFKLAD
ncbi:hypothetical protein M426DRAFT_10250 [Hypoxylon sp. CI-4A]|nr:hypothetical protein M426DRAFT_10250 [Hypoxylon sp. CI-4A]